MDGNLDTLCDMGFAPADARSTLQACDNDLFSAIDALTQAAQRQQAEAEGRAARKRARGGGKKAAAGGGGGGGSQRSSSGGSQMQTQISPDTMWDAPDDSRVPLASTNQGSLACRANPKQRKQCAGSPSSSQSDADADAKADSASLPAAPSRSKRPRKAALPITSSSGSQPSLAQFLQTRPQSSGGSSSSSSQRARGSTGRRSSSSNSSGGAVGCDLQLVTSALEDDAPSTSCEIWADKHRPKCVDDLAVHKSCVDKVRSWVQDSAAVLGRHQRSMPSVLVLSGPTGAGKSALIRVLADELGFELAEWQSPNGHSWDADSFDARQRGEQRGRDFTAAKYESPLASLDHFLLGAARYRSLPIGLGSKAAAAASKPSLILVDDLPHLSTTPHQVSGRQLLSSLARPLGAPRVHHFRRPKHDSDRSPVPDHQEQFRALVEKFSSFTRTPAIFVLSTHRTQSSGAS